MYHFLIYSARCGRRYDIGIMKGESSWIANQTLLFLGILETDKQMIQYRRKMLEDAHNQRWYYREDGFIYPQVDPNLVLDIRVSWKKDKHALSLTHIVGQLDQAWNSCTFIWAQIQRQWESVMGFDPWYRWWIISIDITTRRGGWWRWLLLQHFQLCTLNSPIPYYSPFFFQLEHILSFRSSSHICHIQHLWINLIQWLCE